MGMSETLAQYDPFDLNNPYPTMSEARHQQSVFYNAEIDYWVVTRYEDVKAILADWKTYSSANAAMPLMPPCEHAQRLIAEHVPLGKAILSSQPPTHTRLRRHLNKLFTKAALAKWEPRVRELTNEAIDRFINDGKVDLVQALIYDLPAMVIFEMLHIPAEDIPKVKKWTSNRVALVWGKPSESEQIAEAEHFVAYWEYCNELVQAQIEHPVDSIICELLDVRGGDDAILAIEEIVSYVNGLLFAGHETTTGQLTNCVYALLREPDKWEWLCANPDLSANAIEETMRFDSSVLTWRRQTTKAVTIDGVDIPAGSKVLLHLGSANHDEAIFDHAQDMQLTRENAKKHLSFGHGIHFCLGAPLARLEMQVAIEELVKRLPQLRLIPDQSIEYTTNITFRAPRALYVSF